MTTWIKNAINSTDWRNGRNILKTRKMEQYRTSTNSNIDIKEFKNKHDQSYPSANGMVISCTVRSILQQLKEQGVTVSYGVVLSWRPFFVTFVTEKEIALSL